jgi:hypothetical protein
VILIDAWLSLPLPALIFVLTAFYSASAFMLIRLSFGALAGAPGCEASEASWRPIRFCGRRNAALERLLLETALKVREARSDRLAFSSDFSENFKWSCVLLMALMAQISLAAVHLDEARAQFAAMFAKLLDIVPDS